MFDLKRKMKLLKIINLIDSICFDKKYNKFDLIIEVSIKKNNEKINKIIYLLRDINILYFKYSFNKKIKHLLIEYIKLFNKNRNTDCDEDSLKKIIFKLENLFENFLCFLVKKRRFFYIEQILKSFEEICSKKRGKKL